MLASWNFTGLYNFPWATVTRKLRWIHHGNVLVVYAKHSAGRAVDSWLVTRLESWLESRFGDSRLDSSHDPWWLATRLGLGRHDSWLEALNCINAIFFQIQLVFNQIQHASYGCESKSVITQWCDSNTPNSEITQLCNSHTPSVKVKFWFWSAFNWFWSTKFEFLVPVASFDKIGK